MRQTVIALLLMGSAVATAVAQTAKQNPPAQGHCAIGVQSRLGDEFTVGNKNVSVESWHIDDLVVDRVRAALGKRAAVLRIRYRKEAFPSFEGSRLFHSAPSLPDAIRTLAIGTRCARYVLVTEDRFDWGNSMYLVGVGIVKGALGGFKINAVIRVRVFDGETCQLDASEAGADNGDGRLSNVACDLGKASVEGDRIYLVVD